MVNIDAISTVEECEEMMGHMVFLLDYIRHKQRAIELRTEGAVHLAQTHEKICDVIYKDLPDEFKW